MPNSPPAGIGMRKGGPPKQPPAFMATGRCFIIAEIGVNFNGDLSLAKESIAVAARCGADAVKFQTFSAEEFMADKELSYSYRSADGSIVTETQYEMFKRLELPAAWHGVLQTHAADCGVQFLSSAADRRAVDLLVSLGVPAIKLASEDLINVRLLEYVARSKMPVILSTGMADSAEILGAVQIFEANGSSELVLLHCISSYPAPPETCNLRKITALGERFGYPIGFSDHTVGSEAARIAVALGACLVEKHFTLDHCLPGPDHAMSADPIQFRELVSVIRATELMLGSGFLEYNPAEDAGRRDFRRSIVAAVSISAGEVITERHLAFKRPGSGLKPYQGSLVIGKRAVRAIRENEMIRLEDLQV